MGIWFGTFIPILNFSGMAWVLLAVFGFYISLKVKFDLSKVNDTDTLNYYISNIFSILSHLVVGGLLTFQIDNLWEYYQIDFINLQLTYSITWGIYALLIFLWGAYSKQAFFRWFGSGVLVLVAIKTIFMDLAGSETISKVFVLFILSMITFIISFINNKWKTAKKPEVSQVVIKREQEQAPKGIEIPLTPEVSDISNHYEGVNNPGSFYKNV